MKKVLTIVLAFGVFYAFMYVMLMLGTVIATGIYNGAWFNCLVDGRYYGYNAILDAVLTSGYSVLYVCIKANDRKREKKLRNEIKMYKAG